MEYFNVSYWTFLRCCYFYWFCKAGFYVFSLILSSVVKMPRGAKQQHVTRGADSAKRLCGPATELNETEPPLKRNVIQYYYWLENSTTDDTDYALHRKIARGVINIWIQVNPRLPLRDEKNVSNRVFFYDVSSKDKLCTVFRYFVWHHIVPVQVTFKNSHPHQGQTVILRRYFVSVTRRRKYLSLKESTWKTNDRRQLYEGLFN